MASPLSSAPIPDGSQINAVTQLRIGLTRKYQKFIDDTTPHSALRWGFTAFTFLVYILRVWYLGGWYIVSYALGIYMLNLLIGFLSPKVDPDIDSSDDGILPTKSDDEYRPFIRRLPEFKFWYSVTRAILVSIVCTFFSFLNIPVFWPILLIYFIALFAVTMKNQIKHMIRHRYIPFDFGKKVYKGKKSAK